MRDDAVTRIVLGSLLLGFALADPGGAVGEAAVTTTERPWHHEAEFARDTSLRATSDKVVVLHLEPPASALSRIAHIIPYHFAATETLTFCIPAQDPHIEEMSLIPEGRKRKVVHVTRKGGCRTSTIAAGRYYLTVKHTGEGIEASGKKAFIHVPRQGKVLTEGRLQGGLPGACDGDPQGLPVSIVQAPNGRFVAAGAPFGGGPNDPCGNTSEPPLCASSLVAGPYALLPHLAWVICPDTSGHYTIGGYGFDPQPIEVGGPFDPQNGWLVWGADPPALFKLSDQGNSQFTMTANFSGTLYPVGVDAATGTLSYVGQSATPFTLVATIYLPGVAVPPLVPGQVAVFVPEGGFCDSSFEGTANTADRWVFNASVPDLQVLTSLPVGPGPAFTPISRLIACMRVGPQTIATLYTEPNYAGSSEVVGEDSLSLQLAGNIQSIKITPARQFVVATNACNSCNLVGVDLSDLTLTGGSFQSSTFSGANLDKTILAGAALDHADFSGSTTVLSGTDFTNSTLHCAKFIGADLSSATFGSLSPAAQLTTDFSCRLDLTGATLSVDTLPPQAWRYLNLSGAVIGGLAGAPLSTQQSPLDLRGAIFAGTDLAGAQLDFADLDCLPATDTYNGSRICTQLLEARLTKATLRGATLVSANLQGARLDHANLAGANLCSAQLNESPTTRTSANLLGAHLKDVNLAGADLSGATLNTANFYTNGTGPCVPQGCALTSPCATAAGATMNSTDFTGAYLNGLDVSSATAQGADFSGALLVGVSFGNANLSNDPSNGTPTKFIGAFLQGANFGNANVANANFTNAYVTPETGAIMTFQLDAAAHASFAGYQAAAGSTPGCVFFTYDQPITLPVTDGGNTCPDGNPGPCQPADWQSPETAISSAQPPSTSDGSLPTGCKQLDTNW